MLWLPELHAELIRETQQGVTDPENLNPTDDTTTESSTTKRIILILEDKAELKDKVVDWLRKEYEDPDECGRVQDKEVSVIYERPNDFTEVTSAKNTEMEYTIPAFLWG